MGQGSRCSLSAPDGLMVLDPHPRWLICAFGKLVLPLGRTPQFLTAWTSPWGCLSVLTIWQLAFLKVSDPKSEWSTMPLWPSLGKHTPHSPLPQSFHLKWVSKTLYSIFVARGFRHHLLQGRMLINLCFRITPGQGHVTTFSVRATSPVPYQLVSSIAS